ncbi:hypothetical protein LSH36_22g10047 [Paralvinella palmiformis]|uniref:Uncharacterized protein n=1 Tax=Paralvinella palmiformis TaxID=53620 RepID=A0AAD9KA63_9ANNE|nr:hypothetical protein LSH36_22g10047 [Paralvinella palmiformis]
MDEEGSKPRTPKRLLTSIAYTLIAASSVILLVAYSISAKNKLLEFQAPPINTRIKNVLRPLARDDWQIVVTGMAYVYSAFLDSTSGEEYSLIRILGSLRKEELIRIVSPNQRNNYSCRLWLISVDALQPDTFTTDVDVIRYVASMME